MRINLKSIITCLILATIILFIILYEKSEAASVADTSKDELMATAISQQWKISDEIGTGEQLLFSEYYEGVLPIERLSFTEQNKNYLCAADGNKLYAVENMYAKSKKDSTEICAQRLRIFDCNTREITTIYYFEDIRVDYMIVSNGKVVFFYSEIVWPTDLKEGQTVYAEDCSKNHYAAIAREDGTLQMGVDLLDFTIKSAGTVKDKAIYYEGASDRFIAVCDDGKILVANRLGKVLHAYNTKKTVKLLGQTRNGTLIFKASGGDDKSAEYFWLDDYQQKTLYTGDNLYISSLVEAPDSNIIYRTESSGTFVKWNTKTGEREKICNFESTYLTHSNVTINNKGEIFVLKDGDIRVFSKVSSKERVTIKIQKYELWDPNIDRLMKEYERTHPGVTFETVSVSADENDKDRLETTLKALSNGTGADLVSIAASSFEDFYEAGCIKDISDIFTQEEKDNMFDYFLEAACVDGKIYRYPSFGSGSILVALKGTFGGSSYSATDLLKFLEKREKEGKAYKGLFAGGVSSDPFIVFSEAMDISEFVDLEKKNCNYDTDAFVRILKMCKEYKDKNYKEPTGEKDIYKALMNGDILFAEIQYMSFDNFDTFKEVCGDDAVIVGYPTTAKSGNVMSYSRALVVGKKAKNYDTIKDFLNYLSKNYYSSAYANVIPTTKDYFDEKIIYGEYKDVENDFSSKLYYEDISDDYQEIKTEIITNSGKPALKMDDNGYFILAGRSDGTSYVDEYMKYFESMRLIDERFSPVYDIMNEEVEKMYAGKLTEKETAKAIQKRVSEYLSNLQ